MLVNSRCHSLVETDTMLGFAAPRLCGRARDGALAAIVVILPGLGRFHRGAGLFVTACPETGGMGGKAHVFTARERLGAARVRHSRKKSPGLRWKAGASERAIPLGGGGRWPPYPP